MLRSWMGLVACVLVSEAAAAQGPEPGAGLACFARAYPEAVCKVDGQSLVLCDGERFAYDDGRDKTHAEQLEHADLQDTLAQPYPAFAEIRAPQTDFEPGRVRHTALLQALYGKTASEVSAQLTQVRWLAGGRNTSVRITRKQGVAEHLRAVSAALERLAPALRAQAGELAGSVNFRNIAGTERVSAHAFGIALDVAPALADYFRWREPQTLVPKRYRNRVPREIVEAFEREGFIWGGRWNHYDTMHFEYRPELLQPGCVRVRDRAAETPLRAAAMSGEPAEGYGVGRSDRDGAHGSSAGANVQPAALSGVRPDDSAALGSASANPTPAGVRSTMVPDALAAYAAPTAHASANSDTARVPRYAFPHRGGADTLAQRFAPPEGFTRVTLAADSFGAWLRDLPLQAARGEVRLFDGTLKPTQRLHAAVLDIDVGRRDLQQCADAVMRLRAEYLWNAGRARSVCFRAASGDAMPYAAYREGKRPPAGRASPWSAQAAADATWQGFRSYLDRVFNLANTASLARELKPVSDPRTIEPGDVYIESARGARYGHAVLVLDVAENARGERVFVIAQSYMPAQSIHVLINPAQSALSPWYRVPADGSLETPEWSFPRASLRRFAASCSD